ncbi:MULTISPECIES: hypothetical protein [Bradyrhizobium]|uniref:hypothetical protein n=1 Tax=Bradyrhizobium sp. NBAIM32 TaxID=2793809 RepID=UPI002FDF54B1
MPISSRLRRFSRSELDELSCLFTALNQIVRGASSVKDLVASAASHIKFRRFKFDYLRIVGGDSFEDLEQVKLPFIIIGAATAHGLRVFEYLCSRSGYPPKWCSGSLDRSV